jgi:hypothetical protein
VLERPLEQEVIDRTAEAIAVEFLRRFTARRRWRGAVDNILILGHSWQSLSSFA